VIGEQLAYASHLWYAMQAIEATNAMVNSGISRMNEQEASMHEQKRAIATEQQLLAAQQASVAKQVRSCACVHITITLAPV
jgi:hypothetical protein